MGTPRDAATRALIHFNEGSGPFVNAGNAGGTLTAFGSGSGASASAKFGSYCYAGNASAWGGVKTTGMGAPGTGMFMLSGWVFLNANPGSQLRAFGFGQTVARPALEVNSTGKVVAVLWGTSSLVSTASLPIGAWAHIETHRDSAGVWRLLIGGAVEASATYTGDVGDGVAYLDVGGNSSNSPGVSLDARIDEVIYLVGLTDHEGAFTPPTAAFADPAAIGGVAIAGPVMLLRAFIGGNGRIAGTVTIKGTPNVPVRRRVRLVREVDGLCVDEQWSDASTGAYAFIGFDRAITYTVLAYDGPRVFRATIADGVVPELIA